MTTLTGFVPENLVHWPRRPLSERAFDVVYRGRDLPYWLGRLTQEKHWIAEGFLELAPRYGLRTDIGWREQDRIYGDRWIEFIASGRATLGTESGASIADFDGSVERAVRQHLRTHPGASFDDVHKAVLRPHEGNVTVNVVSPRVFEAAALGTGLVMFPGDYSGVLSPDEHYIVLEKDFSNVDDVAAKLKDDQFLAALTARANDHLVKTGRWSYATFMHDFDDVVADEARTARGHARAPRHRLARMERDIRVPPPYARLARGALIALSAVSKRERAVRSELEFSSWLAKGVLALRAVLSDRDLRRLFREGRRAGMALDSLLEEILDLSLLRRAAEGSLPAMRQFTVSWEFDSSTKLLRFASRPVEQAPGDSHLSSASAVDALRASSVTAIEWDHTALDGTVQLKRPDIDIGIGSDGVTRFPLLIQIGRRKPALLVRTLQHVMAIDQLAARPLR